MIRLIARIDVRNGFHIKTINCEGVSKLRLIEDSLYRYSVVDEHDELLVIDSVASLYGYPNWLLRQHVDYFYTPIPLSIGGGINSVESAIQTLHKGADKIVINTGAVSNPQLVENIASICGRQAIILQIDAKVINGEFICMTHGARELSNYKVSDWLRLAQGIGAGEVHVTSVDSEGTNIPFSDTLASVCVENTDLPIIISGGITSAEQIKLFNYNFGINSFSISSITNRLSLSISNLREELRSYGLHIR